MIKIKSSSLCTLLLIILVVLIHSCAEKELLINDLEKSNDNMTAQTRAVIPHEFDWENADWMPTPDGQSRIPSPWVGQGSLSSLYGLDIINDRKASDGWILMYNSFDPFSPGTLTNPYFVIYNKFRGLMRIFLYITTQFYSPSSYLQDGISIISTYNTQLLNFVGKEIIDTEIAPIKSYSQLHPKPVDGSYPLASNKWYMMQYELAYDPNLAKIPYDQIQWNWQLSSYNITEVNLAGGIDGVINGTIGTASSSNSNAISNLKKTGTVLSKGVLAGVGATVIKNNTINEETGDNKLKIPNNIFKTLSKGVNSAISAAAGDIPGSVIGILNGIFGGSSSSPTAANFSIEAKISLKGTETNSGSFPSMPISFWTPGTIIPSNAAGYIPLYNKSLGVVNFKPNAPKIVLRIVEGNTYKNADPWNGEIIEITMMSLHYPEKFDYSSYLIINPEVKNEASVTIKQQDIIARVVHFNDHPIYEGTEYIDINPKQYQWEEYYPRPEFSSYERRKPRIMECGVRFTIEIIPNNGAQKSVIYKTFKLNTEEVVKPKH